MKVTEDERLAEARLLSRRMERHKEAIGPGRELDMDKVFPSSAAKTRDLSWARKYVSEGKPYTKLEKPSGNLSRDQLKQMVLVLKLPVKREMGLLVDLMYRHYATKAANVPFTAPASDSINALLKQNGVSLPDLYHRFKVLMNDPTTYDVPQVAARNRVQAAPGTKESDIILPVPITRKKDLDRRFTAGTYNSARDELAVRKYMSIAGGPFGGYQIDLLDMNEKSKPYNLQFWYLLTALNTNSRYVYATPVKKGQDLRKGISKKGNKALDELKTWADEEREQKEQSGGAKKKDDSKKDVQWIPTQIIPAMQRILDQIEADVAKDPEHLQHRKMTSVMMDAGSEFQKTLREWLQNNGISSSVCAPETHEEMSRLNSFHRYFRERYQAQWRKFHENKRQYGGPVRWVSPKADKKTGLQSAADAAVQEAIPVDPSQELAPHPAEAATEDDWDAPYTPEEQKLAEATGVWRITYWDDWIKAHNHTKKANSLRGAEVTEVKRSRRYNAPDGERPLRTVRLAKAPNDITDEMVHSLIRYDAARRAVVKQRVDQWVLDHDVITEEDLEKAGKDTKYATRVRVDLNRTKFGTEIKQKGTTFLSIWSERHYPLMARLGTNTYSIRHKHQEDFATVWPIYRIRIVSDPSSVSQPVLTERKASRNDKVVYEPGEQSSDVRMYLEQIRRQEEKEAELKKKEDADLEANARVTESNDRLTVPALSLAETAPESAQGDEDKQQSDLEIESEADSDLCPPKAKKAKGKRKGKKTPGPSKKKKRRLGKY